MCKTLWGDLSDLQSILQGEGLSSRQRFMSVPRIASQKEPENGLIVQYKDLYSDEALSPLLTVLTWMLPKCRFVLFPNKKVKLKLLPSLVAHILPTVLWVFPDRKAILSHLMISLHVNFKLKAAATINGAHSYLLQAAKTSSGNSGGLSSLLDTVGQFPAPKRRRWWMKDGKKTISYEQDSLRNSQHKLPLCMKCLHGIFLHFRTGYLNYRWGALLGLDPYVEADFLSNVRETRWSPIQSQWYPCSHIKSISAC